MAAPQKKGLGKGLSALMNDNAPVALVSETPRELPIGALMAGKYQPRRHFEDTSLNELASSIEKHGLMQPILVRAADNGKYEIIAGERRWRAAKLAKLSDVPVTIRELKDAQALELALIENIQRTDLNPLEEAAGYQRLMDEFGYTQEKLAPVVGKSRSHIANLLRLLKLPESIKRRIDSGELTMGHARAILMAKNPEELAQKIIEVGLSVRQAEDYAKGKLPPGETGTTPAKQGGQGASSRNSGKSDDVLQLESMLSDNLGLRVSINTRGAQAGEVVVTYEKLTELDEILRRLGGSF